MIVTVTPVSNTFLKRRFYFFKQTVVVKDIQPRNLKRKTGFAERGVDHLFQIIGTGVLKKQELLGNQGSIVRHLVKLWTILIQGLVDLLYYVRHRRGIGDFDLTIVKYFQFLRQPIEILEYRRIIEARFPYPCPQ